VAQAGPSGSRGRRPRGLWLATLGLAGAAVGASLAGPPLAAIQLKTALGRALSAESVQASMVVWPPPALWWGRVDVLSIAARHLRMNPLEVDTFDATLDRVRFDSGALYFRRELVLQAVGSGVAHATVSQDALARVLATHPGVRDTAVRLTPGRVTLSATVSVFGAPVPAAADGHLSLRGTSGVDLIFDRLTVAGVGLPPALRNQVAGALNPILDARSLPFGMRLTRLHLDEGKVTLDAVVGGP
jgi:hypothetical protein